MIEPLKISERDTPERRSMSSADARVLAADAGLPTEAYKTAFPLPTWARFLADDNALAVIVCRGKQWRTVEKALAYGVAHARGRKLDLLIPDREPGQRRDPLQATQVRAAFLDANIQLWTHDGGTVSPCELLDRTTACSLLREDVLRGGELDLMDLASRVSDLEEWANSQPDLTARHEKSYRTWRCQGLILLSIQRRRTSLLVKSGVHHAKAAEGRQLPDVLTLTNRNLTSAELEMIKSRVRAGIKAKLSGHLQGFREHQMQATLAQYPAEVGWSERPRLEREFPARRPGSGPAYIDFLRMDDHGILHIVETKIGHDEMLVLQGLDYWIWAQANMGLLAHHFKVPVISRVVIDYVVGPKDGKQNPADVTDALLSPYTPAQLEVLDKDIDWQVHLCTGWATSNPAMTLLGAHMIPGSPYVYHRP
jgi:hypothetical protein